MDKKIYIAGAHSRGQTLGRYLQYLYPGTIIEAYLYNNDEENPEDIEGIKVLHLDDESVLHTDYPVYIGTRGIYHQQIEARLRQKGFQEIYPVTVELDLKLRNEYMKKYFDSMDREFLKMDMLDEDQKSKVTVEAIEERTNQSVTVYVARSILDKPLQQEYRLASYEKEIQVGAALVEDRLSNHVITDDSGDHISNRNRQFCELTALYWIWKQAKEDIIGLVHYRRHFILPDDWVERMREKKIDVILPVPLYVAPSLAENFKSRHDPEDWDYMMSYLKEQDIKEYREAERFFQKNIYSPCNMFIMRREVLNVLCSWLFPILFAVAEHGGEKADSYLNRYPGFLSERLITFFFEIHSDEYRVIYADKNFLS